MRIINTKIDLKKCGDLPTDYVLVVENEMEFESRNIFVGTIVHFFDEPQYFVRHKSIFDPNSDETDNIAIFNNIIEGQDSLYYPQMLELEKEAFKQIQIVLQKEKINKDFKCSSKAVDGDIFNYCEKGVKDYYLQITMYKNKVIFSATSESVFLRYELGDSYHKYFSPSEYKTYFEVEYLDQLSEEFSFLEIEFETMYRDFAKIIY